MAKRRRTSAYMKYKQAYYERARQYVRGTLTRAASKRRQELIAEREEIRKARPLTQGERIYYREEIANNTLTKAKRAEIRKIAASAKKSDLVVGVLRDRIMNKEEYLGFIRSLHVLPKGTPKSQLENKINNLSHAEINEINESITYAQAFKQSREHYRAVKKAVEQGEPEEEPWLVDDPEAYYQELEERGDEVDFDIQNYLKGDATELNEWDFLTGEIKAEDVIDFDKVKALYHDLRDNKGKTQEEASEYIANNIFGSK